MKKYAVIVAGGTGTRMKQDVPKQFMILNGLPVIYYSIKKFAEEGAHIIVVLHSSLTDQWNELGTQFPLDTPVEITNGGSIRTISVWNGLQCIIDNHSLVAIHDAARPLLSASLIHRCYAEALTFGSAIPVVSLNDSLRHITATENVAVNRYEYKIVQTPQCFHTKALKEAFAALQGLEFTDEASLFEKAGNSIHTLNGEVENIKITEPGDFALAQHYISLQ